MFSFLFLIDVYFSPSTQKMSRGSVTYFPFNRLQVWCMSWNRRHRFVGTRYSILTQVWKPIDWILSTNILYNECLCCCYTYGVNDDYSGANFQHTESRDGIVQDVTYDGVPQYGPAVVKTAVVAHPVAHAVAHPDVVAHSVAHVVAHSVTVVHLVAICRQTIIGGWTFYGRRTTMIICRKYSSLFLALHHPVVSFYSCLQTSFKL